MGLGFSKIRWVKSVPALGRLRTVISRERVQCQVWLKHLLRALGALVSLPRAMELEKYYKVA